MNDTITLADPAVSCAMAVNVARRVEALALVLTAAPESPRRAEALDAAQDVLTAIHTEARRVRVHVEDAVEAIRLAP